MQHKCEMFEILAAGKFEMRKKQGQVKAYVSGLVSPLIFSVIRVYHFSYALVKCQDIAPLFVKCCS